MTEQSDTYLRSAKRRLPPAPTPWSVSITLDRMPSQRALDVLDRFGERVSVTMDGNNRPVLTQQVPSHFPVPVDALMEAAWRYRSAVYLAQDEPQIEYAVQCKREGIWDD